VSKVWRTVTYRLATPEEQAGTARSCTNGIFQECRNSPAMKGYDGLGEGRGMSNKYEDLIKNARMNADCGGTSPENLPNG
jgi:hypothetical protein